MDDLKMVISRGKVTFSRETATRCSSWKIVAGDDAETILNVIEDILLELRYPGGFDSGQHDYGDLDNYYELDQQQYEDEIPVNDGIAFQPPKTTVLGGIVDMGSVEPNV